MAYWIDASYFGLNHVNVPFLQVAQAAADIPRLALTEHNEKKGGHENMFRPAVDENDIVISAELPAQMGGRDDTATTTSQDDNSLPSVQ